MGRHVDPWWSVWYRGPGGPMCMRHYSLKIGPLLLGLYRLSRSDYSVRQGTHTAGWHTYAEIVGTRVTTWMDGDCF